MAKRLFSVAIVVAAFFILAVPALAFNGYRGDYTTSNACAVCHTSGQPASAAKVYNDWATTKHASGAEGLSAALSIPTGSVCAGCHTSNYDPRKVIPTPTATSTANAVSWAATLPLETYTPSPGASPRVRPTLVDPQTAGEYPMSELNVGCSSCHYGATTNGSIASAGTDVNDTAHTAPLGELANDQICGSCHSRYAYTTATIPVTPLPYVKVTTSGSPIPNPAPTATIQPQMAIGYPMLGVNFQPLANFLNVPSPGWTPTPTATVAGYTKLMTYWKLNGADTMWQQVGHDGSAAQYPEWKSSGHGNSLANLKAAVGPNPPASCLECHSTDYRIARSGAKPTGAQSKYGITCVGCHAPHVAGTAKGAWDAEFDAQLVGNPANSSDLCATCHNAEIGDGAATPGETLHHTNKEVLAGTGAIGVTQGLFNGPHQRKCVECHMPPTSYSRGSVQLGGNHTFKIIKPADSVNVTPVPVLTTTPTPSASPVVTMGVMPYSACSTCHAKSGDGNATYLQPIMDQRQTQIHAMYDSLAAALKDAGGRMSYAQPTPGDAASYVTWLNGVLNDKGAAAWTPDELLWQKAYTNWTYVAAEGSWGIHNGPFIRTVLDTAINQANQVESAPQKARLRASKNSVRRGATVTFKGTVSPISTGKITIQRKVKGVWKAWKTATVNATGKYSKTVKMTKKGTFNLRAFFPATPPYAGGTSSTIKVVVR